MHVFRGFGSAFGFTPKGGDTTVKPGTVFSSDVSSGAPVSPRPTTWKQIEDGAKQLSINTNNRNVLAMKALVANNGIKAICPQSSIGVVDKGRCYNGGPATVAELIPGGFEMYGVGFNIAEVGLTKSPRFDRAYVPNSEQRFWVEYLIAKRSREVMPSVMMQKAPGLSVYGTGTDKIISIDQALAAIPEFKLAIPNMATMPPPPTSDERTKRGGYQRWIDRGGWPIYLPVARGEVDIYNGISKMVCLSISCRCPGAAPDGYGFPWPACIRGGLPTTDVSNSFKLRVAIDQVAPWNFHLALIHEDAGWLQKLGDKLGSFMESFANMFCGNAPAMQDQMSSASSENCTDKNGKACTKGAAGCTCSQPTAATTGSIGVMNFAAGVWCKEWQAEQQVFDPRTAQPPIEEPPPPPPGTLTQIPWPLVALAGALAGAAAAFSRR